MQPTVSATRIWHVRSSKAVRLRSVFISAAMILLCASLIAATGKKPVEFKEGFKALDRDEWQEAARLLRLALEESPEEDGQRTRIYGSRFERYYPHFYLGKALYNLECYDQALNQFEESLKVGSIQGKDLEQLLTLRDKSEELLRKHYQLSETEVAPCSGAESRTDLPENRPGWLPEAEKAATAYPMISVEQSEPIGTYMRSWYAGTQEIESLWLSSQHEHEGISPRPPYRGMHENVGGGIQCSIAG